MSPAERFARHHKLRTDRAISQAYAQLSTDPVAAATFAALLCCVRRRAPSILAAPAKGVDHPGINALVNLSRRSQAYLRAIADWQGSQGAWRVAIDSLVRHLLAKYPIPRFLTAAWHLPGSAENEQQRRWFVDHASGCSYRSMDVPIRMTRRMEHIFLQSPDHLEIPVAMRRAELIGLQLPDALTAAILSTRLGADLRHGDFWRTVWHFLRANADAIDVAQVAPIIDFLYAIRQERIVVMTPNGAARSEPPLPHFSMKGRTAASMLRLMEEWHCGLRTAGGGLSWSRSTLRPLAVEEPAVAPPALPGRWQFVELTSSEGLRAEGKALRHCVASYASRCWRGASRIWSLRLIRGTKARAIVTLEIDPKQRAIVQARGFRNSLPSGRRLQVIRMWAERERLRLAI